jgi:hypothetical protein
MEKINSLLSIQGLEESLAKLQSIPTSGVEIPEDDMEIEETEGDLAGYLSDLKGLCGW